MKQKKIIVRFVIVCLVVVIAWLAGKEGPIEEEKEGMRKVGKGTIRLLSLEEDGGAIGEVLDRRIGVVIKTEDYGSIYHERLVISGNCGFDVLSFEGDKEERLVFQNGEEFVIEHVEEASGEYEVFPKGDGRIVLANLNRNMKFGGFRGGLHIWNVKDGLVVVNELGLEEYLLGVVPGEMPASYPLEALKAQAICARSYAYTKLLNPAYERFHGNLDDSTSFQVYGTNKEQTSSSQAVEDTLGQILVDGAGDVIETCYYSTSMGNSREQVLKRGILDATALWKEYLVNLEEEEVFREYITAKDEADLESEESLYRWTVDYELLDFTEKLYERMLENKNYVKQDKIELFTKVYSMEVMERGLGGVVSKLKISTDKGEYIVEGEYGARSVLCPEKTVVIDQYGKAWEHMSLLPSGFFMIDTRSECGNVVGYTLCGGGFGHGRGMSQNGAKALANLGYTSTEIITFFYDI